jgi:hypothetical protein
MDNFGTVGSVGNSYSTGGEAFAAAGQLLSGLPRLAAAFALLGVLLAVGNYLLSQKGDPDRYAFIRRVARMLAIVSFLAALGSVVAWVFSAGSDSGTAASMSGALGALRF